MADVQPVHIDWSLLKTPDYVGDYQNAFKVGRDLAGQQIQQPAPCHQAVTALQAQAAREHAEKFSVALYGLQLSTPDLNERLRIAQHVAPSLGVDPAHITLNDVTDKGIAAHMASVASLQQQLTAPAPSLTGPGAAESPLRYIGPAS